MQGAVEFKTEIELLSRVHHKNLVGLVGFSFDKGEQMLVYEYIPNGTLMDSLSGTSKFQFCLSIWTILYYTVEVTEKKSGGIMIKCCS